jgi:hypothetical protein
MESNFCGDCCISTEVGHYPSQRGRVHNGGQVRKWPKQQNGRIVIAFLFPCAAEINPIEEIWAYLKEDEIANVSEDNRTVKRQCPTPP